MIISEKGVLAAIRELLPHFVVAGRLACRVQDDLIKNGAQNNDSKAGDQFTEALTDADIIIETYLGTIFLTTFEDAAFYGEEYERDRVSNYFPKEAPYLLTLDPIDGTLYFKDGLPFFSTILTICTQNRIVGALIYLPRKKRFYLATESDGAFTTTAEDVTLHAPLLPYSAITRDKFINIDPDNDLTIEPNLKKAGFDIIHQRRDYDRSPTWFRTNLGLFTGEFAGSIVVDAQVIDIAAMAFIVDKAGGKMNGTHFNPETKRIDRLVLGTAPDIFEALMKIAGTV